MMKISDTKKFGQDLDSFLKKTKGGHFTPVNIQWVSSGEKNSSGRYFYDVLVYVNLQHGEKLAYLLNVVTTEDGTITRINYPESGITVGSNTPEQIVKQFNSIPADEQKYKTYKEETMKTDIAQIKSVAESISKILEGGDAQYGPAARNADSAAGVKARADFAKAAKASHKIAKSAENKMVDSLTAKGFEYFSDRGDEVKKLLKPGVQIAWPHDMFVNKSDRPGSAEVSVTQTDTVYAKAYKPKTFQEKDTRMTFRQLDSVWIKQ